MLKNKKNKEEKNIGQDSFQKLKSILANPKDIKLTSDKPWVCFTKEIGVADLSSAGGLGYLAGDWFLLAAKLGIPFAALSLYYRTKWRQKVTSDFRQKEDHYRTFHPGERQFTKLKRSKRAVRFQFFARDMTVDVEVFIRYSGNNPLIMIYEPGIKGLYEGATHEEHRLYQSSLLGFTGIKILEYLKLTPQILHLNEAATVTAAIAYLDTLSLKGYRLDQAREILYRKTIFTNHTISPAAEPVWHKSQLKKYWWGNIGSRQVLDWLNDVIEEEKNEVKLSNLAMRLAEKRNAVSRLHSIKLQKNEGIPFHPITNGIDNRWIYPDFWQFYKNKKIISSPLRLPAENFRDNIDRLDTEKLVRIKKNAKVKLISYLRKERYDQYQKRPVIPLRSIIAFWARRFDSYKRPDMLFKDLNLISEILEDNNIHLILAGKAHQTDTKMKQLMAEILTEIDKNSVLKKRIHFIANYDWRLAFQLAGADIILNTPQVGWEACGTSWEKAVVNCTLLISTPDGGAADILTDLKNPQKGDEILWITGKVKKQEIASLYHNLEKAARIVSDREKWGFLIKNQLKAFLDIANGTRMMIDYLNFRFSRPSQ